MKWRRREEWLRSYSANRSARVLCGLCRFFDYREGWFVVVRTVLLFGILLGELCTDCLAVHILAGIIALYLLLDALAVNTSYVFLTGSPISPVRSVLLTMGTYLDLALCFAVPWVWIVRDNKSCPVLERAITATYESLRTLATLGPENPPDWWAGRLLVVSEILVGIYFVAVVVAIYVSWARTGRPA
jgi:hypothetical protein